MPGVVQGIYVIYEPEYTSCAGVYQSDNGARVIATGSVDDPSFEIHGTIVVDKEDLLQMLKLAQQALKEARGIASQEGHVHYLK